MSNFAANTDTRTARTRADERGFITFFRLIVMDNNPHILGTERIGKLLLQYSIPAIIGMTITSLYNIIDSIFIGHGVGAMGIAGLAITFPLIHPFGAERFGWSYRGIGKYADVLSDQCCCFRRTRLFVFG